MKMDSAVDVLIRGAGEIGIKLGDTELERFELYSDLISFWNEKINLVSYSKKEELYRSHFLDSLMCSCGYDFRQKCRVIDLGSGAGFPAVPIKICFPEIEVLMVDARRKRCDFLKTVIKQLSLKDCYVEWGRFEIIAHQTQYRERFDCGLARALAPLNILIEYALPFLKTGGRFIALKGSSVQDEIEKAENALNIIGGRIEKVIPYLFPGEKGRHIVIVEKTAVTPDHYPRREGIPTKKPL
jgi:16S rRNA (guanine527-N7)-methyltransferase